MATRKEIAKLAGVSERTVYRALNNMPEVNEATRQKVRDIAQRLGYQPNAIAQALVRKETKTLGIIVGDCSHPLLPRLTAGHERLFYYDWSSCIA